jgi:hypothetical protein
MASMAVHSVDHEIGGAVFNARVLAEGYPALHTGNWATRATSVDLPGERVFVHSSPWSRREIVRTGGALVDVALFPGQAAVTVAAETEDEARTALEHLRELLPAPDPSGAQEVTVTFWTYGPHGPQPAWRSISVPEWAEIERNYSSPTRQGLGRLMSDFKPAHGGQLVLWHGAVGTGKTFALRALVWEWREWCDIHYIVDPDSFFGQHADYLMHVLLQSEWEGQFTGYAAGTGASFQIVTAAQSEVADLEGEAPDRRPKGWRLLVLEDTGELLQPDAKAVIGQGLSRFLNVADGLIGQGLRVLVLVTTNEEIRKLHPAVARPGRSAANVRFDPLAAEEATAWLTEHGVDNATSPAATIAELFARLEGLAAPKQSVGFDNSPA